MNRRIMSWFLPRIVFLLIVGLGLAEGRMLPVSAFGSAGYVPELVAPQDQGYLYPVADATISTADPDANFGTSASLDLQWTSDGRYVKRALLRFDLAAGLPQYAVVERAELHLWLRSGAGSDLNTVTVSNVAAGWGVTTVTWNNQPSIGSPQLTRSVSTAIGEKVLEVTALAQAWQAGSNYGLELRGPETDGDWDRSFYSDEGEVRPHLVVTYHLEPPATFTHTPTHTSTPTATTTHTFTPAATTTRTFTPAATTTRTSTPIATTTRTNTPTATTTRTSTPTATTIRTNTPTATLTRTPTPSATRTATAAPTATDGPGSITLGAGKDSWISQIYTTQNHGADTQLRVQRTIGDWGAVDELALLYFNLAALPAHSWVTDARLEIYQDSGSNQQITVRKLDGSWTEMGVTWQNAPTMSDSGVPTVALPGGAGWQGLNVTALVQQWTLNPLQNFGMILHGATVGQRWFSSREGANPPRLRLTYIIDTLPPHNPNLSSPSHTLNKWTDNPYLVIQGTNAYDEGGSGIGGYSYVLDHSPATWPTEAVTSQTFGTYQATIGFNTWYFHIRTVDGAGNWSGPSHFGPVLVDDRGEIELRHTRLTQGLETDVSGGTAYDLIQGKDTLARFSLYSTIAPLTVVGANCEVFEMHPGSLQTRGVVPGVLTFGKFPVIARPDAEKVAFRSVVSCWIPGALVSSASANPVFAVRAHVFDLKNHDWGDWIKGPRQYKETADYFGWLIYEGFQHPAFLPATWPVPLTVDNPALWPLLREHTLPTMQRLWPLRAGIEAVRLNGSNPHTAGLRYFIALETYTCGDLERDHPLLHPSTGKPDPMYTCFAHLRSTAEQYLAAFNLQAQIKRAAGIPVEELHRGTVVVPYVPPAPPPQSWGGGQSCWGASKISDMSISVDTNYREGWVMAHEPAHCLGLVAANSPHCCSTTAHAKQGWVPILASQPVVNFRTRENVYRVQGLMDPYVIVNNDDRSIMEGWEWNQLRATIQGYGWPAVTGVASSTAAIPAGEKRFFLLGQVDRAGAWKTVYSMIVDETIAVSETTSGPYAVAILSAGGAELVRWPFDIAFDAVDGAPAPYAEIAFTLPYPAGSARIRVLHGAQVLAELTPPVQRPTVYFDSLTLDGDTVHAAWTGAHPGGAALTYALYFSPDDGQTRLPLATSLKETTYDWQTGLAQGAAQARLIVVASDGFNTAEATSTRFSIPRRPPSAAIGQPNGEAATAVAGQRFELKGSGFDLNDGMLSGEGLRWSSDLQGFLGSGDRLAVELSQGTHRIVLQVTSSAGLVGSASVTVTTLPDTDRDGLSDDYENGHTCLNPGNAADAGQDQDGDGLTAQQEAGFGADPCVADTDHDGANDGAELAGGSDPLDPNSQPLPALAAQPAPLRFVGCGALPAPAAQTITLVGAVGTYAVTTDAPWLHGDRQADGRLRVSVECGSVPAFWAALPVEGMVLLTAEGKQPLAIEVKLGPGLRIYLPLVLRAR